MPAARSTVRELLLMLARFDRLVDRLAATNSTAEMLAVAAAGAAEFLGAAAGAVAPIVAGRFDLDTRVGLPADWRARAAGLDCPEAVARLRTGRLALRTGGDCLLALPLTYRGELRGALVLGFVGSGPAAELEPFLGPVASQIALALERTELFEAERQARERLAFLAEASAVLASSLDVEETLRHVTRLVVPRLADWCVVHLEEGRHIRQVAFHHRDRAREPIVAAVLGALPVRRDAALGAGAVIRSGRTQVVPAVTGDVLAAIAGDDDELHGRLADLASRAALVVPLAVPGHTLGALSLVRETDEPYRPAEVELAEELGRRAGLAVENASVHALARDALRQRDAAAELADFERDRLSALLEQLPVGVVVADAPSGRIRLTNPASERIWRGMTGTPRYAGDYGQVDARRSDGSVLDQGDWPLARAVRGAEVRGERVELAWPDGDCTTIEVSAAPVRDRDGQVVAAVAAFTDVTERTAYERALTASEQRALGLAHTLQASLLPPELPEVPGLELAAAYRPVGEGLEVGGDFYDVLETAREDEWGVVVGDVCGKGAEAAGVTALARHTLRATTIRGRRPGVILRTLNEVMLRSVTERPFLTAVYAALRHLPHEEAPYRATFAVGGHPLPLLLRADGSVAAVGRSGSLVGVLEEAEFPDESVALRVGDVLLFFTDGLTEARRGRELFGEQRVREVLAGVAGGSAGEVVQALLAAVAEFQDGQLRDDLALLAVRVRPNAADPAARRTA